MPAGVEAPIDLVMRDAVKNRYVAAAIDLSPHRLLHAGYVSNLKNLVSIGT